MSEYIELHCRSAFSFLRGGSLPEKLAETAANLGLSALGLCDRMGVYGAPRFRGTANEVGLRAINGAELAMEDGSALAVLVENRKGYQNLCRLLTRAHLRAPKGEGVVRWDELPEFAEGLVALTGDAEGPLVRALLAERSYAAARFYGSFPLTPARSPGERERRSPRSDESQRGGRTARAGPLGDGDELFGLASKKRTVKLEHLVSCFGFRSQRANSNSARCERAGDCRSFRCNRRFLCGPGYGWQSRGGKPVLV